MVMAGNFVVIVDDGHGGTRELRRDDDFAVPHAITYQAIYRGAQHTFWHDRQDEARRHLPENALAMERDCGLQAPLQERYRAVNNLRWHLAPEDPKDPAQALVAGALTKLVKRMPYLERVKASLLESVWYGKYAVQHKYVWGTLDGRRALHVVDNIPLNGDKIGFQTDRTPYVLINAAEEEQLTGATIISTTVNRAVLLTPGFWRQKFTIAKYFPRDADYWMGEQAAAIGGVGVRNYIYWLDFMRQEYVSWIADTLERVGLGLVVIKYDSGNPVAQQKAADLAKNYNRKTVITWPVTKPQGGEATQDGVHIVEGPTAGAQFIQLLIQDIEQKINRFIIGQSLSSSPEGTGLGGTGVAEFQNATKHDILKQDALQLAEALTGSEREPSFLWMMKRFTFPEASFPVYWRFDVPHPNPEAFLGAVTMAWNLGVKFRAEDVRGALGLPEPGDGDEVLESPVIQQAKLQMQQQQAQLQAGQQPGQPGQEQPGAGGEPEQPPGVNGEALPPGGNGRAGPAPAQPPRRADEEDARSLERLLGQLQARAEVAPALYADRSDGADAAVCPGGPNGHGPALYALPGELGPARKPRGPRPAKAAVPAPVAELKTPAPQGPQVEGTTFRASQHVPLPDLSNLNDLATKRALFHTASKVYGAAFRPTAPGQAHRTYNDLRDRPELEEFVRRAEADSDINSNHPQHAYSFSVGNRPEIYSFVRRHGDKVLNDAGLEALAKVQDHLEQHPEDADLLDRLHGGTRPEDLPGILPDFLGMKEHRRQRVNDLATRAGQEAARGIPTAVPQGFGLSAATPADVANLKGQHVARENIPAVSPGGDPRLHEEQRHKPLTAESRDFDALAEDPRKLAVAAHLLNQGERADQPTVQSFFLDAQRDPALWNEVGPDFTPARAAALSDEAHTRYARIPALTPPDAGKAVEALTRLQQSADAHNAERTNRLAAATGIGGEVDPAAAAAEGAPKVPFTQKLPKAQFPVPPPEGHPLYVNGPDGRPVAVLSSLGHSKDAGDHWEVPYRLAAHRGPGGEWDQPTGHVDKLEDAYSQGYTQRDPGEAAKEKLDEAEQELAGLRNAEQTLAGKQAALDLEKQRLAALGPSPSQSQLEFYNANISALAGDVARYQQHVDRQAARVPPDEEFRQLRERATRTRHPADRQQPYYQAQQRLGKDDAANYRPLGTSARLHAHETPEKEREDWLDTFRMGNPAADQSHRIDERGNPLNPPGLYPKIVAALKANDHHVLNQHHAALHLGRGGVGNVNPIHEALARDVADAWLPFVRQHPQATEADLDRVVKGVVDREFPAGEEVVPPYNADPYLNWGRGLGDYVARGRQGPEHKQQALAHVDNFAGGQGNPFSPYMHNAQALADIPSLVGAVPPRLLRTAHEYLDRPRDADALLRDVYQSDPQVRAAMDAAHAHAIDRARRAGYGENEAPREAQAALHNAIGNDFLKVAARARKSSSTANGPAAAVREVARRIRTFEQAPPKFHELAARLAADPEGAEAKLPHLYVGDPEGHDAAYQWLSRHRPQYYHPGAGFDSREDMALAAAREYLALAGDRAARQPWWPPGVRPAPAQHYQRDDADATPEPADDRPGGVEPTPADHEELEELLADDERGRDEQQQYGLLPGLKKPVTPERGPGGRLENRPAQVRLRAAAAPPSLPPAYNIRPHAPPTPAAPGVPESAVPPLRSNLPAGVNVRFSSRDDHDRAHAFLRSLAPHLDDAALSAALGGLMGGEPGHEVSVRPFYSPGAPGAKRLELENRGPGVLSHQGVLEADVGKPSLRIEGLFLGTQHHATPLVLRMLANKARALRQLGGDTVRLYGSRMPWTDEDGVVRQATGYRFWPKLGADGPLPARVRESLPEGLREARTLQQLYALPGGQGWWEANGRGMPMTVSIAPGSKAATLLERHLARRGREAAPQQAQQEAFALHYALAAEVDRAAREAAEDPSDRQRRATNHACGHVRLHGADVTITHPKGTARSELGWDHPCPHHFGYLKGTGGKGGHLPVIIGPDPESELIFVVTGGNGRGGRADYALAPGEPPAVTPPAPAPAPTPAVPRAAAAALHPATHALLAGIRQAAGTVHAPEALGRVQKLAGHDPEDVRRKLHDAWKNAEVTINFPADVVGADLARDRRLRNLFETGRGGGEEDARARSAFERTAFGEGVDALPPGERPKYGAVNWQRTPGGPAPTYGHSVIVLDRDRLADRMTLTPGNSSSALPGHVAHAHDPVNALARHSKALNAAGVHLGANEDLFWSPYTEAQVWGHVPIDRDHVKEIRLHRPLSDPLAIANTEKVEQMAKELGIPVRYHND